MTGDPHGLERFVLAQEADHQRALAEIRSGRKRSHWMWYVFPQLDGLGSSSMSRRYAIKSLAEAEARLLDKYFQGERDGKTLRLLGLAAESAPRESP